MPTSRLEKKTDFEDKKALEKLLKEIEKAKLKLEGKIVFDEEHSLYEIPVWRRRTTRKSIGPSPPPPEYKRLRGLAKQIEEFNHPPFTITRNGDKVSEGKSVATFSTTSSKTPKKISPSRVSKAWAK